MRIALRPLREDSRDLRARRGLHDRREAQIYRTLSVRVRYHETFSLSRYTYIGEAYQICASLLSCSLFGHEVARNLSRSGR